MIELSGFVKDIEFSHEVKGKLYYNGIVGVERFSNVIDKVPIVLDGSLGIENGKFYNMKGEVCTRNKHDENVSHLIVYVYVNSSEEVEKLPFAEFGSNNVKYDCTIVKKNPSRVTPLGKTVCDFVAAINYPNGISAYIPCICWGSTAKWLDTVELYSTVSIRGRFQSREYTKVLEDGTSEERTAYEISCSSIRMVKKNGD